MCSGRSCSPLQIYVGNYEYDASEREIEKLLDKYGRVERVEFKSGATLSPPSRRRHRGGGGGATPAPAPPPPATSPPPACLTDEGLPAYAAA